MVICNFSLVWNEQFWNSPPPPPVGTLHHSSRPRPSIEMLETGIEIWFNQRSLWLSMINAWGILHPPLRVGTTPVSEVPKCRIPSKLAILLWPGWVGCYTRTRSPTFLGSVAWLRRTSRLERPGRASPSGACSAAGVDRFCRSWLAGSTWPLRHTEFPSQRIQAGLGRGCELSAVQTREHALTTSE